MWSFLREQRFFLFEIMLVIKFISFMSPGLSTSMLIQDKICLYTYSQEREFCQNLQKQMDTVAEQQIADDILTETARYNNYKQYVETIPTLVWTLFLGPFLDTYPNAMFLIFFGSILNDIVAAVVNLLAIFWYDSSPYYLLINSALPLFTGGNFSFSTTVILFLTRTSRESIRGIKFIVLEIIILVGMNGANMISGQMLKNSSTGTQLRTYHIIHLFALALLLVDLLILAILFFLIKSEKSKNNTDIIAAAIRNTEAPPNALKAFLSIDNARQTLWAFFRPRKHHVRLQIYLLCFVQYCQMAITRGLAMLMMQFEQKVYHWDPATFTTYSAILSFGDMAILAVMSGVLISWLKMSDSSLILMAQLSNFSADLVRGTFLSRTAFFVAAPLGCLNGFGIVSARAKFTKIVPKEDSGKVFTLSAFIEGLVPLDTTVIYTKLFALSISTYPGLIYHFSCFLMILTVSALIIEKRFCPVSGQDEEEVDGKKVDYEEIQ